MSQYDVAIGMDHTTLDKGTSQLYADGQAREKLFKGSEEGEKEGLRYKASWDIQASPTFTLAPPPADKWQASIDNQGQNPKPEDRPSQNAFQLVFPQFHAEYTMGSAAPISGTTEVIVFATVAIQGDTFSITPQSVWLDESKMPGWDRFILNQIILKQVLQQAQQMLSGLHIPAPSFSLPGLPGATIELTPPLVTIENGLIIMAASLKSKGSVDVSGVQWPKQPLFVLMSANLLEQVARDVANLKLMGAQFSGDGDYEHIVKYSWTATINSVDSISASPSDMTKISAKVGFSFNATLQPLGVGGPCAVSAATASL